jgi:hypothetical protein
VSLKRMGGKQQSLFSDEAVLSSDAVLKIIKQ